MTFEEVKKMLKAAESITFSRHFYGKTASRGIGEEEIETHLKSPDKLIGVEDQGEEAKGHKYAFLFGKSHRYDLKIVVSFKDKRLNVITAHIQNIRRREAYQKWLKKQR